VVCFLRMFFRENLFWQIWQHSCGFSFKWTAMMCFSHHIKWVLKFNTILAYLICQKRFSRKSILKKHTTEVHLKENPLEFNVWQPKKSNDHFSATAHNEREDYTAKSIEYPTLARYLPQKNLSASQCTFSAKQLAIEACVFTEPKHSARPIFCAKLCSTKLDGLQLPV
jgi:hypothetical protein